MKLLLDECVNQKLRPHLVGHEVFTVGYLGWDGTKNGALLRAAAGSGFDGVITTDRAMADQHNAATLPLPVFILVPASDQLADLVRLVPSLLVRLGQTHGNTFVFVRPGDV